MTRRKKIISLLIALVVVFGALFVFPLTASAANVTVGSSLFTNTKNMSVKGTENGIALRVEQKEFAYTEYAATLPMEGFSMDFKIIDDNFEELVLTFSSMYDENVSNNYNLSSPSEEEIRSIIQPEKVKNVITLTKVSSGGINININESDLGSIGSGFKDAEFTVKYNKADYSFTVAVGSEQKTNPEEKRYEILNNEANLKIEFPADSITAIKKDVKDEKGEITEEGAYTLLVKKISYLNPNTSEQQTQAFTGDMTEDTSKPILKTNNNLLTSNEVFVPVGAQYKIPVYGLDIIKSSSTLTIRATVKYYESDTDENPKDQTVSSLAFQVDKTEGYYLIERLTISDGTTTLTFEDKDGSIKIVDGITLPIKVTGVARTTDPNKVFAFNIGDDYAELFNDNPSLELKGGSKNKIIFPMPQILDESANMSTQTGVRSFVNGTEENPYNIMYQIWYKHENDTGNFTRYTSTGLEFTATKTGTYYFKLEAYDRQGNNTLCDTVIRLKFVDTEKPEISISSFPEETIVNEKFTIPTASTTDDFDTAPTKTIKLYYLNEDGTKGEQIALKSGAFTPDDTMLEKKFIVVYSAKDSSGHEATEVERVFKVVKANPPVKEPFIQMDGLSILFLCLGGAALLGVIALIVIKPKDKKN